LTTPPYTLREIISDLDTHTHTHNPVYFNNRLNTPKSTLRLGEVAPHTNDDIQPHMERNKL